MFIRQEIGKTQEESTTTNTNSDKDEILYRNYINALKSKTTKEDYIRRLKYFLEFLGYSDCQYSAMLDPKLLIIYNKKKLHCHIIQKKIIRK